MINVFIDGSAGGSGSTNIGWSVLTPSTGPAWAIANSARTATSDTARNGYVFTEAKTSGKWCLALTCTVLSISDGVGGWVVCDSTTSPPNKVVIGAPNGVSAYQAIWTGSSLPTFAATHTLWIAVDIDAGKGWIGNASLPGDPAAGTGNNLVLSAGGPVRIGGYRNNNGGGTIEWVLDETLPFTAPAGYAAWA